MTKRDVLLHLKGVKQEEILNLEYDEKKNEIILETVNSYLHYPIEESIGTYIILKEEPVYIDFDATNCKVEKKPWIWQPTSAVN